MATSASAGPNGHDRRLNGWKEISAYFDRSTRTVQRWEREYRLPVRRLGIGRGEVVYAYVDDLARWQASAEAAAARGAQASEPEVSPTDDAGDIQGNGQSDPPDRLDRVDGAPRAGDDGLVPPPVSASRPAGRHPLFAAIRRHWIAATAIVAVAAATTLAIYPASSRPTPAGEPATWRIDLDTLSVYSASGQLLWRYRFPFEIEARVYQESMHAVGAFRLQIRDVDADGHREVLILTVPAVPRRADWRFYCFSDTGALRWTHSVPERSPGFGNGKMAGVFSGDRFFLTPGDGGRVRAWLSYVYGPWFPSVLVGVDDHGRTTSEYWSAGYVSAVSAATWNGRPVLLVGARNNESLGASLAVLDAARASGSAPSVDPEFRCTACPEGAPLAFVEMPRPSFTLGISKSSPVTWIEADNPDAIVVSVGHFLDAPDLRPSVPGSDFIYTFDRRLRPLSVRVDDHFDATCQYLLGRGRITACPRPDLEEIRTVRWWNGTAFEDVTAPLAQSPAPPAVRPSR